MYRGIHFYHGYIDRTQLTLTVTVTITTHFVIFISHSSNLLLTRVIASPEDHDQDLISPFSYSSTFALSFVWPSFVVWSKFCEARRRCFTLQIQ